MGQCEVLQFLKQHKNQEFRSRTIAKLLKISQNNASRNLAKLKHVGFIEKNYKHIDNKMIPLYTYKEKEVLTNEKNETPIL